MLFSGLYEQIRGRPDIAINVFQQAIGAFGEWPQLYNACYWLMSWCHATLGQWDDAAKYAQLLVDQCRWSPCTSTYQLAVCKYMKYDEDMANGLVNNELRAEISDLMEVAPSLRRRVAGKTIFVEKFVTKRCQIYLDDDEQLTLPILELFLVWNIFPMMRNSTECLHRFKASIDAKLTSLEGNNNKNGTFFV